MAESVVSFAVETIGNLLTEAKFLWGVEDKVEDLQKELDLIQCFLRDADSRREHNQAVGEWVAQVRDIAYDAEDVIEQYILRVASKKGQNIIKSYACFVAKCTCMRVHGVGTKIEGLKSSISNLRMSMQGCGIQSVIKDEREQARASMPRHTYAHVEENIVGREDSIKELVKELKDGKHRVVSIWGMGGLGKTTLAKKVFNHDEVKSNFKGSAWACVSQQYHVKDILVEFFVMEMRDDELFETLYKIQQEERYLMVLDDIWTKQDWNGIRAAFPVENTRSKLLITTRNRVVPKYIDPHGFFYEPHCLSNQESWELLMKRVFPKTKIIPGEMKRLGDQLLKKCEGLPLAIIVLGGLLAINEWETIHKNINLHLSDRSDVSKVLALSYDDLPWYLKLCFLCLGSFLKDAEIPATEVLHMWIAEGFVSLKGYDKGREIQVEDVAEQYLMELFERGMVQVRFKKSGKMKTCHLHDLMRDLEVSLISSCSFLMMFISIYYAPLHLALGRPHTITVLALPYLLFHFFWNNHRVDTLTFSRTIIRVSKALQESFLSILNIQQDNEMENYFASMATNVKPSCKIRRLSLDGHMISSVEPIGKTLVHLQTLMLFGFVKCKQEQFQSIFNHYKFLTVLKLEKVYQMKNLPESVGHLVHLRFLSLAGSDFEGLPQSMGNLVSMEFFDLLVREGASMALSNVLWKMKRLRYLQLPLNFYVKEKFHGDQKKLHLGTLKNLRTLINFRPEHCNVKDVGQLTNLQKLIVFDEHFPIELEIFPQIVKSNLKHLRSLSFCFQFIDGPWTEAELSKIKIEKLLEHNSLPHHLRKLALLGSFLEEDPMPILEKLDHLVVLLLGWSTFMGKEMVCYAGGFPQLKHLVLHALPNLEEWRVARGAMPHLSRLGITCCPNLKAVPEEISYVYTYHNSRET
ncbi:hypothetical protein EUGRSUZ_E00958, partial [Eucalyptus grandis]